MAAAAVAELRRAGSLPKRDLVMRLLALGLTRPETAAALAYAVATGAMHVVDPEETHVLGSGRGIARKERDAPDPAPAHRSPRRVLVVDDDPHIRSALLDVLAAEGYGVDTAPNGKEALRLLARGSTPGAILLDLAMPIMDGWQLHAILKEDEQLATVPVIVITAHTKTPPPSGPPVLSKPLHLERILSMLYRALADAGPAPPG